MMRAAVLSLQILPVNIKGLAGSIATLANWFTSWVITMTANLLLNWSDGGQLLVYFYGNAAVSMHVCIFRMHLSQSQLFSLQEPLPFTLL